MFMAKYPHLVGEIENNIYAIAKQKSLVDFPTYCHILKDLNYKIVNPEDFGLKNVEGCVRCQEKLVLTEKAAQFFTDQLKDVLKNNTRISLEELNDFDLILNCTAQSLNPNQEWDLRYEPCVIFVYAGPKDYPAFTIMDGALGTIYPLSPGYYTTYSVVYSRMNNFPTFAQADFALKHVTLEKLSGIRNIVEQELQHYCPSFPSEFEFSHYSLSVRTQFNELTNNRTCLCSRQNNVIQIMPSKIDCIFYAEEFVRNQLSSD